MGRIDWLDQIDFREIDLRLDPGPDPMPDRFPRWTADGAQTGQPRPFWLDLCDDLIRQGRLGDADHLAAQYGYRRDFDPWGRGGWRWIPIRRPDPRGRAPLPVWALAFLFSITAVSLMYLCWFA